jgi:hypothetical protein
MEVEASTAQFKLTRHQNARGSRQSGRVDDPDGSADSTAAGFDPSAAFRKAAENEAHEYAAALDAETVELAQAYH